LPFDTEKVYHLIAEIGEHWNAAFPGKVFVLEQLFTGRIIRD